MLKRLLAHGCTTERSVRRLMTDAEKKGIAEAIGKSERLHNGEIAVVVENALPLGELLRGMSARERAIQIFSMQRIWDTEHNSGVLLYLLMADHKVEIVADRGIDRHVRSAGWEEICRDLAASFRQGKFADGITAAIERISQRLIEFCPVTGERANEIPNEPRFI